MPLLEMTGWKPKITAIGAGGGGDAINNMIARNPFGVGFTPRTPMYKRL